MRGTKDYITNKITKEATGLTCVKNNARITRLKFSEGSADGIGTSPSILFTKGSVQRTGRNGELITEGKRDS